MPATPPKPSIPLKIVLYYDGHYWIAYCLELDILTSGPDLDRVQQDAINISAAQILYAYQNDLLEHVMRPPNRAVSSMLLKELDTGGVQLNIETRVSDHHDMEFRLYTKAA